MKAIRSLLLCLLVFAASCSDRKQSQNAVRFASAEDTHPATKNFEDIEIRSSDMVLGAPYQLKVADSLLLIVDRWGGRLLTAIDRNTDEIVGRYLSVGRGPGEVLAPVFIEYQNDSLYVLERQTTSGRVTARSLDDLLAGRLEEREFFLPRARRFAGTGSGFLTSGTFSDNLIHEYDVCGDSIAVNCNFYPDFLARCGDAMKRYFIGQGSIAFRRDMLAVVFDYLGEIKFYGKDESGYTPVASCAIADVRSIRNRVEQGDLKIRREDPLYFAFGGVAASDDAFYVLTEPVEPKSDREKNSSILLKFGLDGRFVESYRFDRRIECYTVTPDNVLYAVTLTDAQPALAKARL